MFQIGGGRGMLWFTEIDTLVFDVVLLFAAYVLVRYLRASARNPLVWLVLLTTLLVALPLAYTVTNFGTLFRLREMIYSGLLLMPVAVMTGMTRPGGSAGLSADSR
jgi:magnesium-transporting ATPase (P-type)